MNHKRGFTVIESVIYVFIMSILMFIMISVFTFAYKNYIEILNKGLSLNYIEQYFLSLDNLITEGSIEAFDKDTQAFYIYRNNDLVEADAKRINKIKDKLIVTSFCGNTYQSTYNTLIEDVADFEVVLKGNIYYIVLNMKDGRKIIRSV